MSHWNRLPFLLFCVLTAAVLSACQSSLVPCENYFGDRLLEGEAPPADGQPTQLVGACMYGAEVVGPVIFHRSTFQIECAKMYNLNGVRKRTPGVLERIPNTIALADACGVGARGYVRFSLSMDAIPDSVEQCESSRGRFGINPELPCN